MKGCKDMCAYDVKKYIEIMDCLGVKQMILQGPPGTSKTHSAKEIIAHGISDSEEDDKKNSLKNHLIKESENCKNKFEGRWDMVQFHPSYGYEDFVRGITVDTDQKHGIKYETVDKVFGRICHIANEDKDKKRYFLLIDEINRADVATVLGELIYALENRGEEVSIPYGLTITNDAITNDSNKKDYRIKVPENLYIIGTMNTADKSVGNIDYAIRRRFLFFDCVPDKIAIEKFWEIDENNEIEEGSLEAKVIKVFNGINHIIEKNIAPNYNAKDFKIGHTYFLVKDEKEFEYRMRYQVLPIMREYYSDGIIKLSREGSENLVKYLEGKSELDDNDGSGSDVYTKIIKEIEEKQIESDEKETQ